MFSVVRPTRDAAWQNIAGEAVVLDIKRRVLRGLNATGGRVWALLDGHRSVEEVAAEIAAKWTKPESQVQEDVLRFVEELRRLGLVEVVSTKTE